MVQIKAVSILPSTFKIAKALLKKIYYFHRALISCPELLRALPFPALSKLPFSACKIVQALIAVSHSTSLFHFHSLCL